ncbi:hypothetical protein [Rhodococcus sp. T7]|uniref:hypothetical protein n=1 Tax=Rhodococcus sp. T7 TaxID=627444 RepID=UPI00135A117B|nr:hypothetical protein [Rhodococcus sp. T7]KAF0957206.1 hypothetical protein MLGJGCBP_09036 [Rhodococcus sp. T7]KAF0966810.1 hypothetical protein MLGJGCBP_00005 [Rhodococcus sp. T7]
MRPHHRLRGSSLVGAAVGVVGALLFGAPLATAVPTETVFPIPVAGIGVGVTGLLSANHVYMTATTDPDTPGVTRVGPYTGVFVHWRNISTGEGGITYLDNPGGTQVRTGSGTVVAAVTVPDQAGTRVLAFVPGAGAWYVP